jgi:hypothetical protein
MITFGVPGDGECTLHGALLTDLEADRDVEVHGVLERLPHSKVQQVLNVQRDRLAYGRRAQGHRCGDRRITQAVSRTGVP